MPEDKEPAPKPEASKACPESDVQAMVAEVLEEDAEEEKSEDAAADEPMADCEPTTGDHLVAAPTDAADDADDAKVQLNFPSLFCTAVALLVSLC